MVLLLLDKICLMNKKQAKISMVKPIIKIANQRRFSAVLKIPTNIYHLDINTNDNGIPAEKNNNIINSILYILLDRHDTSLLLIFASFF